MLPALLSSKGRSAGFLLSLRREHQLSATTESANQGLVSALLKVNSFGFLMRMIRIASQPRTLGESFFRRTGLENFLDRVLMFAAVTCRWIPRRHTISSLKAWRLC